MTQSETKGWKERSKKVPIEDENQPTTKRDLEEIRSYLTENKRYSQTDLEELVSAIRVKKLKFVFLEADFPSAYELFNVNVKMPGNVTEITFNRKHPAFDDIFGTVATIDEDVTRLSKEEISERLLRAVNATAIVFAAWARIEYEAVGSRAEALKEIRFDWGQIAAKFLRPDDDIET